MSQSVSKEALIETFHQIVSEMEDTINEMKTDQCFLNVFEEKDITGIDLSDFALHYEGPSVYKTLLMHLYANKLSAKNAGAWNFFPYPETRLINMYEKIVYLYDPFEVLGMVDSEDECCGENVNESCETIWTTKADEHGNENGNGNDKTGHFNFLSFFRSFFLVWYTYFFSTATKEKLNENENEKNCHTKVFAFFRSIFLYIYFLYQWYFDNDVKADECGMSFGDSVYVEMEAAPYDWSCFIQPLQYVDIARCECTLIQSLEDLEATHTLLCSKHYSQSVFMSTQTVEKCLKSILTSYQLTFTKFFNKHDAKDLLKHLIECCKEKPHHPYSKFADRFETLCYRFESIGAESWTCPNPLSIRCRYFNFQTVGDGNSHLHYYVDSYPGLVYTQDLATEAYEIANEIFSMSEEIFDELLNNFQE